MAARHIQKHKIALVAALISIDTLPTAGHEARYAPDVLHGFNESAVCIRSNHKPSQWCAAFHVLLRTRRHETLAFLLGANFGFSFKSESIAEAIGASESELRNIAGCATLARLRYEKIKSELKLKDADVAELLNISPGKFAAWKARTETNDFDRSVTGTTRQIKL
jgi:hypothetical protein